MILRWHKRICCMRRCSCSSNNYKWIKKWSVAEIRLICCKSDITEEKEISNQRQHDTTQSFQSCHSTALQVGVWKAEGVWKFKAVLVLNWNIRKIKISMEWKLHHFVSADTNALTTIYRDSLFKNRKRKNDYQNPYHSWSITKIRTYI